MSSRVHKFKILVFGVSAVCLFKVPCLASEATADAEKAPAAKKEIKSREESFTVVQARVQVLEAKVNSGKEEIQKLLQEKQAAKDNEKINEIIRQILTLHKELGKTVKEYDQQRALLKYRYPEKGMTEKRQYERIEVKSVEEMESELSLSSTVQRTLKKVRSQYETPEERVERAQQVEQKAVEKKKSEPGLVDAVILKK